MFTMSDEQIRKKFIEAISRHDVTKTATIKHLTEVRSTVALMEEKIKTDKAVATNLKAELAQVKESHTKALNELKAQHAAALKRALLDKHIALTLGLTGLSLNENALALLKQCEGEKEIDEMVEKFRRAGVEEVLHSKTDAITVESAEPPDPTKVEVVGRIGKAFQGMNKH
jgi:Tfp pilus assembly protein PilO